MSAFHAELRRLVSASGATQCVIARQSHISKSYLSMLLNGRSSVPSPTVARNLDTALNAGGTLMETTTHDTPWTPAPTTTAAGTRPDAASVVALDTALGALRRLDDQVGAAGVVDLATAHASTVRRFREAATGSVRADLMRAEAESAAFLGWLHWDGQQPDPAVARAWYARALELALEAEIPDLVAVILSRRSLAAWLVGRHGRSVELAAAAMRQARHPLARVHAAQFDMRSGAAVGDRARVDAGRRAVDVARAELESGRAGPDPAWLYFVRGPGWDAGQLGTVLMRLGDHRQAEAALVEAAGELGRGGYRRDAGTLWARVAACRAASGDREGAAEAAGTATLIGVESASTALELAAATAKP